MSKEREREKNKRISITCHVVGWDRHVAPLCSFYIVVSLRRKREVHGTGRKMDAPCWYVAMWL